MPNYLSPEAVHLLRKMLVVNPVNRITVAEIRQDPWFSRNLPDYLKPQEQEFIDTGVDPNRHPRNRERNPKAAGELHEVVVGKLKKTLGYGNDDVHEALGKEEPSAIKDAYNIVKENQMMIRDCKRPRSQLIYMKSLGMEWVKLTVWVSTFIERSEHTVVPRPVATGMEFLCSRIPVSYQAKSRELSEGPSSRRNGRRFTLPWHSRPHGLSADPIRARKTRT